MCSVPSAFRARARARAFFTHVARKRDGRQDGTVCHRLAKTSSLIASQKSHFFAPGKKIHLADADSLGCTRTRGAEQGGGGGSGKINLRLGDARDSQIAAQWTAVSSQPYPMNGCVLGPLGGGGGFRGRLFRDVRRRQFRIEARASLLRDALMDSGSRATRNPSHESSGSRLRGFSVSAPEPDEFAQQRGAGRGGEGRGNCVSTTADILIGANRCHAARPERTGKVACATVIICGGAALHPLGGVLKYL